MSKFLSKYKEKENEKEKEPPTKLKFAQAVRISPGLNPTAGSNPLRQEISTSRPLRVSFSPIVPLASVKDTEEEEEEEMAPMKKEDTTQDPIRAIGERLSQIAKRKENKNSKGSGRHRLGSVTPVVEPPPPVTITSEAIKTLWTDEVVEKVMEEEEEGDAGSDNTKQEEEERYQINRETWAYQPAKAGDQFGSNTLTLFPEENAERGGGQEGLGSTATRHCWTRWPSCSSNYRPQPQLQPLLHQQLRQLRQQ